tara:strand:- start:8415 stop:9107 length:693 start_codon:yes stop_codon:yes gene_type:complete
MDQNFIKLQKKLGIDFKNLEIYQLAFKHPSYLNENFSFTTNTNQRLEFLGDSILGLVLAEFLYTKYPEYTEGLLTDIRSELVKDQTLSIIGKEFNLGDYLILGKGENKSGGREKESNIADAFEALLGAIFIDKGFNVVKTVLHNIFSPRIDLINPDELKDPKTRIQEYYLNNQSIIPTYKLVKKRGNEHNPIFTMSLIINNEIISNGEGSSKKQAEQNAAKTALEFLNKG